MGVVETYSYLKVIPTWTREILWRKQHHQGETAKNGNYKCPWLMASVEINIFFLASFCAYSFHVKENCFARQSRGTVCFAFCSWRIIFMMYILTWKSCESIRYLTKVRDMKRRKRDKSAKTLPVKRNLLTFTCCLFSLHTVSADLSADQYLNITLTDLWEFMLYAAPASLQKISVAFIVKPLLTFKTRLLKHSRIFKSLSVFR